MQFLKKTPSFSHGAFFYGRNVLLRDMFVNTRENDGIKKTPFEKKEWQT